MNGFRKSLRAGFSMIEVLVVVAIIGILAAFVLPRAVKAQGLVTPPYSTFAPNYWKQMTNVQLTVGANTTNVISGWQTNAYDIVRQANGEAFLASVTGTNSTATNIVCSFTNIPPVYLNNVKAVAIRAIGATTNAVTFFGDVTADGTNWTTTDPVVWTLPIGMSGNADTTYITVSLFEVSRSMETGSTY